MRIDPVSGVIEVGSITYSPRLQRRPAGTEAMYLMMRRVFDELGYRRYEWKCNALNAPSRAAALRYGFQYEGLFRQAQVTRGRNRDTTWFSIIDSEWPALRTAFETPGLRYKLLSCGAYFAYVRHPFDAEASAAVARRLATEHNLLCLPGSFFGPGQDAYLRFAFANLDASWMPAIAERLIESQD